MLYSVSSDESMGVLKLKFFLVKYNFIKQENNNNKNKDREYLKENPPQT